MAYTPKTKPFSHQKEDHEQYREELARGRFWEMGTGKTKPTLDDLGFLYDGGEVRRAVVVAPNGVHSNWVTDEIPAHLPDDIAEESMIFEFHSKKARNKSTSDALDSLMGHEKLAILAMSYEGIMTPIGRKFAEKFLNGAPSFMVLDESHRIKSPGAKRTIGLVAMGRRADYRRILSGTPVTQGPFDLYSQIKFLNEEHWRANGFASYEAFKTHFGIWETGYASDGNGGVREFPNCVAYRNIPELRGMVRQLCSRVTKEQVLDLPEKLYTRWTFDMTSKQRKIYNDLRDEQMVFLDSGDLVTAPLAITQLLRLQQVTCGYLPTGDEDELYMIPGGNPRVEMLMERLRDVGHQAIVACRFRLDIQQIREALRKEGISCVEYHGAIGPDERTRARQTFNAGDAQIFLGTSATMCEGLTLTRAKSTFIYSNSFKLGERLQLEDRNHRIGQDVPVHYNDFVARGTVDTRIVGSLRRKFDIATELNGDELREWI